MDLGERRSAVIRILTTDDPHANIITIDGQLVGEYADAIEASIQQARQDGKPVQLFLRDVSNIDEHGRRLLSRLAAQGVRLSASGLYSSYIVSTFGREPSFGT